MSINPYKIFIIYAREDVRFRDELKKSLTPLERRGLVKVWSDRDISPGTEWDAEIRKNLETADLILPLISNDYFESEYIHEVEIKKALERHAKGEARVIPVIIKPCLWEDDPALSRLQVLPTEGLPIDSRKHWDSHDNAWHNVGLGLRSIIIQMNYEKAKKERQRQIDIYGLEMILVDGGAFTMGSDNKDKYAFDDEKPQHQVSVASFYIGKYPITVAQFKQFIDDTGYITEAERDNSSYILIGSKWEGKAGVNWRCNVNGNLRLENEDTHPVIHVSWNDANVYCNWLSNKTNQYFRLPSEAEWEYAARGGKSSKGCKYAGSNNPDDVAWYSKNSGDQTHPVGQKNSNEINIYDMSGNVWEWCEDNWHDDYLGAPIDGNAWRNLERSSNHVRRGGNSGRPERYCRITCRSHNLPEVRASNIGFRIALSL